jgi:hypothetical protein
MTHLQFFICLNMIGVPIMTFLIAGDEPDTAEAIGMIVLLSVFVNIIAFGIRLAIIWG